MVFYAESVRWSILGHFTTIRPGLARVKYRLLEMLIWLLGHQFNLILFVKGQSHKPGKKVISRSNCNYLTFYLQAWFFKATVTPTNYQFNAICNICQNIALPI